MDGWETECCEGSNECGSTAKKMKLIMDGWETDSCEGSKHEAEEAKHSTEYAKIEIIDLVESDSEKDLNTGNLSVSIGSNAEKEKHSMDGLKFKNLKWEKCSRIVKWSRSGRKGPEKKTQGLSLGWRSAK